MKSDERVKYSVLLDIYGDLLTEKQKSVFSMYVNEDLSIVEIAEMQEMSRQAVSDTVKTVTARITDLEDKLKIGTRQSMIEDKIDEMLENTEDEDTREDLNFIRNILLGD